MIINLGITHYEDEYSKGWYFRPFANKFLNVEYEEYRSDDPSGSFLLAFGGDFAFLATLCFGLGRHFSIEVHPRF